MAAAGAAAAARAAWLPATLGQVGRDAEHPLDHHQLTAGCIRALGAEQHLEPRLGRRLESGRQRDFLRQLIFGEGDQEIGELLATGGQRFDDRRLGGESVSICLPSAM